MTRFLRFNVVSALGVAVQVASLWVAMRVAHVGDLAATALAVSVAVVHNFVWHWCWTWADRALPIADSPSTFVRFIAANGAVSIVGNLLLMAVLVHGAHMPALAANLAAIGTCGLV